MVSELADSARSSVEPPARAAVGVPVLAEGPRPASRTLRREHVLFALLASLAAAALVLAWSTGRNVPYWDEWENVPYVAGKRAISAEWLWSSHAQHRFVLPRLVYVGVMRVAGNDFRVMPFVNVTLLAIAAGVLLVAARRARGSWRWSDAVFPLALLHWGNAENMLWGFQVSFTLTIALFCFLVAAVLRCDRPLAIARVIAVVVPLLLLPLAGGVGVALAVGFAPWLVGIAIVGLRSRRERAAGGAALAGALALGALLYAYASGSGAQRSAGAPATAIGGVSLDALEFLAGGLGPAARSWHPFVTFGTGVLLACTVLFLTRRTLTQRNRAPIEAGLLCLVVALSLLAAVVAWGRTPGVAGDAFVPRYVTLAAPLWCLFHLAWSSSDRGALARFVSPAIVLALVCALPWNSAAGFKLGMDRSQRLHAFEMDAWSGVSILELARRHAGSIYPTERLQPGSELRLAERARMLERTHLGPFALDADQRWKALQQDYARFLLAHQSQPWIPVLLDEDEDRARIALLSPAPGRIALRVPPGRWTLRGFHGLRRDAWEVGRSDGVVFAVDVRVPARPATDMRVFERWLRPVAEPGDRGPRDFEAAIETDAAADVVLITEAGPTDDARFDSAYWGGLAIVPAEK